MIATDLSHLRVQRNPAQHISRLSFGGAIFDGRSTKAAGRIARLWCLAEFNPAVPLEQAAIQLGYFPQFEQFEMAKDN
jgi:hypothetical protein